MAEWSRNKVDSSQLNNGNEFDNNSSLALDEINAVVNGGLYSQDFSEHLADTPDTTEANNVGTATVSFVDNIVNGKTFKKLKFSNLKGDKGLEYLTVNRAFASRYPVGNIAPYYLNDFNRTPVVNDIFSTICANQYYTTFKIINTETKQMQSIGEVNIKGEQGNTGDTGENYLTINAEARFPTPPEINMVISVSILYFNRTPLVNDILLFVYRDVTTNRSWLASGKIDSVSQVSADINIISLTETTGDKGDTGLIRNNFLTQTTIPVINTVYNFNQQSNFSRIPVVGETFLGVWKQSQDNRSWLFTAEVTSSSEESVLAKVVSLSETTASIDNAVDLVSNQTVGGEKTFTDDVYFKSDDGTDKKIEFVDGNDDLLFRMRGSVVSKALVLNSTSYYIRNRNNSNTGLLINPDIYIRPEKDNSFDLGTSGNRLKDVYVAGNLSDGTTTIAVGDIAKKSDIQSVSGGSPKYNTTGTSLDVWEAKTWNGLTGFNGDSVWTDGENIYYSYGSDQYVLDKSTSTWSAKTWSGLTDFYSSSVWTDGENIYYSVSSSQYVLDKSTSTWKTKTWSGLTSFSGLGVWTDGENIYYSGGSSHYVLDKSTSTWSAKTWSGLTSFNGNNLWTDGENIYYSNGSTQYVLNKSTSTWSAKTWNGLTGFYSSSVWTDGENIYYSGSTTQNVLDKSTSAWSVKTWNGLTSLYGFCVWTDGENIYYSYGSNQYVLTQKPINIRPTLTR